MSRRDTEALLRDLARDLSPVRTLPRLRTAAAVVLALAGIGASWAVQRTGGLRADLASTMRNDLVFAAIAGGLALLALGLTVGAAALAVPGRSGAARRALGVAATGAALAFLLGPASIVAVHDAHWHGPSRLDVGCLAKGLVAGSLASLALVAFVTWAAPRRRSVAVSLAAAAGAAFGGLAMHAVCPAPDPLHWLYGHAAAPWMAALAILALAPLLRRFFPSAESESDRA